MTPSNEQRILQLSTKWKKIIENFEIYFGGRIKFDRNEFLYYLPHQLLITTICAKCIERLYQSGQTDLILYNVENDKLQLQKQEQQQYSIKQIDEHENQDFDHSGLAQTTRQHSTTRRPYNDSGLSQSGDNLINETQTEPQTQFTNQRRSSISDGSKYSDEISISNDSDESNENKQINQNQLFQTFDNTLLQNRINQQRTDITPLTPSTPRMDDFD